MESIHQYIESMKAAYLADQRRRGEGNDPFLEADRRETARQEAAAKRVHPTLNLPANSQPSTQVAGLLPSSGTQGASSTAQQTSAAATFASSGSGLSLFGTPASAPSSVPSSLFATPSTSAPVSSLFGSSGATPQTSLYGSSSASLFGSASTPSLFGTAVPSFGSATPPGGSLFSTPFASGILLPFLVLQKNGHTVNLVLGRELLTLCFYLFIFIILLAHFFSCSLQFYDSNHFCIWAWPTL